LLPKTPKPLLCLIKIIEIKIGSRMLTGQQRSAQRRSSFLNRVHPFAFESGKQMMHARKLFRFATSVSKISQLTCRDVLKETG